MKFAVLHRQPDSDHLPPGFLRALGSGFEPGRLETADLILARSWQQLRGLDPQVLAGKKIACEIAKSPFDEMADPEFRHLPALVDLWVTGDSVGASQASLLGWKHAHVPRAVDTTLFSAANRQEERARVRKLLALPESAYVLGCFSPDEEGSQLFCELLRNLRLDGHSVGAAVAGAGAAELNTKLAALGIPSAFAADPAALGAGLFHALDVYVISNRWESDPRVLLEAGACSTKLASTPLGLAQDLLPAGSLFRSLAEGLAILDEDIASGKLAAVTDTIARKIATEHSLEAAEKALVAAFATLARLPRREPVAKPSAPVAPAAGGLRDKLQGLLGLGAKPGAQKRVSFLREFVKPPYGGGNQFMLALKDAFERAHVPVAVNEVGTGVRAYFFDSLWFKPKLLKKLERYSGTPVVHRIDGPIYLYRGKDKELDDQIFAINRQYSTATVIQSNFTLTKIFEASYSPRRVVVIRNAANPAIFFPKPYGLPKGRKLRIIASSWSGNANKGGPIYKWLDTNLDRECFEFTFVGRCSEKLENATVLEPVPSEKLAGLLREHDIYVTASQNDPCSNALVEAMSCGLPAIALRSGGHPELVGYGGLCFDHPEEIPACLTEISRHYESYQRLLSPPRMDEVSARYLALTREA